MKEYYKPGDKVNKKTGYKFPGVVRSIFNTSKGEVRYVVELDDLGLLHIFNGDQLELAEPTAGEMCYRDYFVDGIRIRTHRSDCHSKAPKEKVIEKIDTFDATPKKVYMQSNGPFPSLPEKVEAGYGLSFAEHSVEYKFNKLLDYLKAIQS